jgi:signal transduction histidine kinase
VFNKIQSLDLQMNNLAQGLGRLQKDGATADLETELAQARDSAAGTMQAVTDLRKTVQDFQRMMRNTDEQSVDVNHILEVTESQVHLLAQRQGVRLDLDLAPDLPDARVNSVRIQQVFINLMLNAIQQLAELDPRRRILHVSSRLATGEDGQRLHIRFSDTGPGIHYQRWEKIFALGFTTREGGSGLGLFIARSLVQSMGGRISVEESLVPMGTTFLVELPVAAGA